MWVTVEYELSDHEEAVIKPMLPNKPRGVPRVKDRAKLLPQTLRGPLRSHLQ